MAAAADIPATESYAALIARKLLLPSDKTRFVAVDMGFLVDLMRSRVAQIRVDEKWYLGHYQDVSDAVRDGLVKDAREHFVTSGFYEHRLPYEVFVDESWYLEKYVDVGAAVRADIFPSGQAHFEKLGYREGRLPFAGFHLIMQE